MMLCYIMFTIECTIQLQSFLWDVMRKLFPCSNSIKKHTVKKVSEVNTHYCILIYVFRLDVSCIMYITYQVGTTTAKLKKTAFDPETCHSRFQNNDIVHSVLEIVNKFALLQGCHKKAAKCSFFSCFTQYLCLRTAMQFLHISRNKFHVALFFYFQNSKTVVLSQIRNSICSQFSPFKKKLRTIFLRIQHQFGGNLSFTSFCCKKMLCIFLVKEF